MTALDVTADNSNNTLDELKKRIEILERQRWIAEWKIPKDIVVDESMRRARHAVERAGLYSAVWKFVPSPYYTWPLDQRRACLGAPTTQYLCKSLLMENKKVNPNAPNDPTNPRFVLVVIQYAATLDNKKLVNAIRTLRKDVKKRLDPNQFDFRIASTEDNDTITGYKHNSVTPFGLLQPHNVSIVLSDAVVPLKRFWMGGGHGLLKLQVSVTDFVSALHPIVADISQPRTGMADDDMTGLDD